MASICEKLSSFLEKDKAYAYLDCDRLPNEKFQYGGGLGRIAMKWPKCFRKKYRQHSVMRYLRAIYGRLYGIKILKGKKLPENMTFYGQSDWFTLSEKCVKNIILYLKLNPNYYDIYRNSLIGSELFFNSMAFLTKSIYLKLLCRQIPTLHVQSLYKGPCCLLHAHH